MFLKRRNELATSVSPKGLKDHRREQKLMITTFLGGRCTVLLPGPTIKTVNAVMNRNIDSLQ